MITIPARVLNWKGGVLIVLGGIVTGLVATISAGHHSFDDLLWGGISGALVAVGGFLTPKHTDVPVDTEQKP